MTYEYKVITLEEGADLDRLAMDLEAEGWEFCGYMENPSRYQFRRPVVEADA